MDDEDDPAEDGHVIFSLLVNSGDAIDDLAGLVGRRLHPKPQDDHLYIIYEITFDEPNWSARADRLDSSIHEAIDALTATGIDFDALGQADVTVRAYFIFPAGAETISAHAVQRLAACHATIWIDTQVPSASPTRSTVAE